MINVVYKKTNGMLHDLQWKEEKDMDTDDFILEGFDHVPDREEVKTLHDASYIARLENEKERADTLACLSDIDLKSIRAMRELLAGDTSAINHIKEYEAIARAHRNNLVSIKIDEIK